jgi:hypothetical protein
MMQNSPKPPRKPRIKMEGTYMIHKLISAALIAAMFATPATPAEACTDWAAIAAFDALVLQYDSIALAEEREPEAAKLIEADCDRIREGAYGPKAEKDPAKLERMKTSLSRCHGAETAYEEALDNLRDDRTAALADTCQENAR